MSNPIALWNGIIAMAAMGMLVLLMLLLKNEFKLVFERTRKVSAPGHVHVHVGGMKGFVISRIYL
jgi:hypothetical protein